MKRLVIILCITALVGMYIGCTSNAIPTVPAPGTPRYVSAEVCNTCHIELGIEWSLTGHADALPALLTSNHVSESCYVCHVVSLDDNPANSGYDDPNPLIAAKFGGVQCENCHGPGSEHIKTYKGMSAPLDSELCGTCHASAHHPTYTEWVDSAHATAQLEWQNSTHFTTECQECHSADYIFADSVPENAQASDFKLGITCVVCHDPHSEENPFQTRMPVGDLCGSCHNSEGATPGESVHHPNAELVFGTNGYKYPGETYTNSPHAGLEKSCAACHMWTAPFSETINTAISGHSFKPLVEACQVCHPDAQSFDYKGRQTIIVDLLAELKAKLDAATANDKLLLSYTYAKFNYDFINGDGSKGVHNFDYASKLLQDSIDNFEPGS